MRSSFSALANVSFLPSFPPFAVVSDIRRSILNSSSSTTTSSSSRTVGAESKGRTSSSRSSCTSQSQQKESSDCSSGGSSGPPSSLSPEEKELALSIASKLAQDPTLSHGVIDKLSGDSRRRMLVSGVSEEWYGKGQVKRQLSAADLDRDDKISQQDYRLWVRHSMATSQKAWEGTKVESVPWKYVFRIAVVAGAPFVAFGCLDNSVMLLSGDAIDNVFGDRFDLTQMGAAALGGVCSGVAGIQMHGFAEKAVQNLGLTVPELSPMQNRNPVVFRANHLGGTLGMVAGLTLGMWPLLVIEHKEDD